MKNLMWKTKVLILETKMLIPERNIFNIMGNIGLNTEKDLNIINKGHDTGSSMNTGTLAIQWPNNLTCTSNSV